MHVDVCFLGVCSMCDFVCNREKDETVKRIMELNVDGDSCSRYNIILKVFSYAFKSNLGKWKTEYLFSIINTQNVQYGSLFNKFMGCGSQRHSCLRKHEGEEGFCMPGKSEQLPLTDI